MALTKDEAVKRLSTVIKPNASAQTAVQNQPVQTQAQQTQMPQIPQTDYQKAVSRLGGTATKQATPGLADELIRQNANRAAATLSNIPTFDDPYTLYDDLKSYRESADKALRDARNAALLFRDEENIANFKSAVDQYNRTIPGILEKYGNYATILSGDLSTATAADAKHIADLAKARAAELTPVSKKVIGEKPTFLELMAAQPLNPEQIYGGVKPGTVERRADISDEVKAEIEKYQSLADYYDYLNEWLSDAKNLKSRDEWINSGKDLESVYTQFKEARQKEGTWSNGQTREELETRLKDLQGEIAKHTAGGRRSQTLDAMLKEADGIRQQLKELPEYTMPEYGTTSFSDELLDLLTSGYGNLLLSSTQYKDIADELLDEIKSEASNLSGAYKDFMDYQQGGLWQAIEHAEGDEAELQALFARNPTAEEAYRTKVNFEKLQKQAELLGGTVRYRGELLDSMFEYATDDMLADYADVLHLIEDWHYGKDDDSEHAWVFKQTDKLDALAQQAQQHYERATADLSPFEKWATQMGIATIQAIPAALMASATAGTSLSGAAKTVKMLKGTSKAAGIVNSAASAAATFATNPMFWDTFLRTTGASYMDVRDTDIADWQKSTYALLNGMINAAIEVGGGPEALPRHLREMNEKISVQGVLKQLVKSMGEEGMEEVYQGIVERALQNIVTQADNPWIGLDEFGHADAVLSVYGALGEFVGGAVVSAALGGAQSLGSLIDSVGLRKTVDRLNTAAMTIPAEFRPARLEWTTATTKADVYDYAGALYAADIQQGAENLIQNLRDERNAMRGPVSAGDAYHRIQDTNSSLTVLTPIQQALVESGINSEEAMAQGAIIDKILEGQMPDEKELKGLRLDSEVVRQVLSEHTGVPAEELRIDDTDLKKFYVRGIVDAVNQVRRNQETLSETAEQVKSTTPSIVPEKDGSKRLTREELKARYENAVRNDPTDKPIDVTGLDKVQAFGRVASIYGMDINAIMDRREFLQEYASQFQGREGLKHSGDPRMKLWKDYSGSNVLTKEQQSDLAIAYKNYLRNDLGLKKSGVDAILEATSGDLAEYKTRGGKAEQAEKEEINRKIEESKAREKEHDAAQKRAEELRKQQERIDAAKEEGRRQGLAEARALAEAAQKRAAEQSAPVEEEATPAPVEEPAPAEVTPTEEGQEDVSVLNEGTGPAPERTEEAREAAIEGERRLPQGARHSIRDYTRRADLTDNGDYILEIENIHGDQTSPEGIARHRVASVLEKIAPLFGVKEIHWVLTGDQYGFPLKDGGHAGAFFEPRTQSLVMPLDALSADKYSVNHISFGLHELFHALVKETDSAILTYLTKTLPKENANYESLLINAAAQDRYDPYRLAGDDEYEEVLGDVFGAIDEDYLYPLHTYVINAIRRFVPKFDVDGYYNTLAEMREMFPPAEDYYKSEDPAVRAQNANKISQFFTNTQTEVKNAQVEPARVTTRTEREKEAAKLPGADILAQAQKAEEEQRKSLAEQAKQTVKEAEQVLSLLSKPIVKSAPTNAVEPLEDQPLENLDLPTRVRNTLNKAGINTIGDLLGMTESGLTDLPGVGAQTLKTVTEALSKRGKALRVETEATVETAENLSSQAEPTEKVEVTVTDGRKKSVSLPQFIQRLISGKQQAAEISAQERHKQQRAEYDARVQELKDKAAHVIKGAVPTLESIEAARAERYNRAIELSQRIRSLENQLAELSDAAASERIEEIEERINELQNKNRLTKKEAEELLDLNDEYYELTEEGQLVFDEATADRMEPILQQIDLLEQEQDRVADEIAGLTLLAVQAKEAETGLSKKEAADAVEAKLRAINDRLDQMYILLGTGSPDAQTILTAYRNLASINSELAELPLDTEAAQKLRKGIDTTVATLRALFANRWAKVIGVVESKELGTIERIARVRDWFSYAKQSHGRQGSAYILKLQKEIRAVANELVRDNTISEARKEELKNEIREMYAYLTNTADRVLEQEEKNRNKITYIVNGKTVSAQEWARLQGIENWKTPVYGFTGKKYGYLSTFTSYPFEFDGLKYHSAEAAYQAQKTLDPELRKQFADKRDSRGKYIGVTPEEAKRMGAALELRPDWENVKLSVMFDIQKAKFEQNPYLRADLVKTEHRDLLHLNRHNDRFWGVVEEGTRGEYEGENYLGQILMQLRSEFIEEDAAKAAAAKAGQEADRVITGEDRDAEAEAQDIREKYKTGEFEEGDQAGHDKNGNTTTGRLRWGSSSFDTNEDVFAAGDAIESLGNARSIVALNRGEAPTQLPPINNMRAILDGFIKLWKSPFVLNTYHLYNDAVNKARMAELTLRNTKKNNIVGLIDLIEADIKADAEKIAKTKENSRNFYEHLQDYVRQAMGDYANDTRLMKAAVEFALSKAKAEDLHNKIESRLARLLNDYSDPVRPQDPAWNDIYDTLARGVALGCITPAAAKQAMLNAQRKSGGAPITSGQVLLDAQKLTDLTIDSFTHKRQVYDAETGEGALSWDRANRPSVADQAEAAERRARYENRIPGVDAQTESALLHSSFYSEPDPETGTTKNQQLQELSNRRKTVAMEIQNRLNSLRSILRAFIESGIFVGTDSEQAAQAFLESEADPFARDPVTGEASYVSEKSVAEIEQSINDILRQIGSNASIHEKAEQLGDTYTELMREAREIAGAIGTTQNQAKYPGTLAALRTELRYLDEQIGELTQQASLANELLQDAQMQTYLMENGLSAEDVAEFAIESAVEGIEEPDPHLVGQYRNINNKGALGMSADMYGRPDGKIIYDYGMGDEESFSPGEDMQSMEDLGYREYNADWYEFDTGATDERGNPVFQYINKDTGEVRDTPPDQTKLFIRPDDPRMKAIEHLVQHGDKEESFTDHFDKTFDEARDDEWRNASAGNITANGISRVLDMRSWVKKAYDALPDYLRPAGIDKWHEDGTPVLTRKDDETAVDVNDLIAENQDLRAKRGILPPKSISATDRVDYEKQDLSTVAGSTWDKIRQTWFNAAHALDKAARKQTSTITFKEELKMARNSTSVASAILDTGLVDNEFNLVGDSFADMFLEYDIDPDNPNKKKYNAERQKTKEYVMLLMHHIDRMNAPKRLQQRVATMLVQQPWLADLTDEQIKTMAAKGDPIVSEFAEAVSMMNDALDSKEKPVLAGDIENPLEPMSVAEAQRQLREIISENPWVVERCKEFYLWYDLFYRSWALGDSLTEHRYELMHEIYPHYVPTNRADRTEVDEAREALDAFVIQHPEYKGPHTDVVMAKAFNEAKKGDEAAIKFIQLRNALERAEYTVPKERVLGGGSGGGISAVHGSVSAGTVTHAATGSLRTVRPLADQIADEIVRITKLKLWTDLTRMINAEAMMDRNHEIFNGELSWDAAYTAKVNKKAYAQMFEETEDDLLGKDSGKYYVNSWMNGQRVRTQVNQQIYQGLDILLDKNSDAGWSSIVRDAMTLGRKLNNASKNFITAISPTFAIRNPIRDLWSAVMYTENGVGLFLKNYFTQSWRQMITNSENWQDFVNMGGKQSTLVQSILERKVTDKRSRKRTFQQAVDGDPWYKHPWQNLVVNPLATVGEFTESMTRFAEYLATIDNHNKKTALVDQLTKKKLGIQRSAEVTVDFGRYGAAGMFGNAFVRYFNANMQGLSKTFRTVTDQPDVKSKLKRLGRVGAIAILPRIIAAAVIKAMGRWDEYEKLSEYVRASSLVFPIDKEGRKWVRIPFSRDWGVLLGVPAQDLLRGVWDDEDGVLSAMDLQRYWKTAFAPNVMPPGINDALVLSQKLNLAKNEDFKGSAIVPRDMENLSKHLQYDKDTSVLSYYTAQGLYKLGDAIGLEIELSPAQMDYLIENFFGDFWSQAIPLFWPYGLISKDESGDPAYTFKDSAMAVIKDTLVDTWVTDSWRSNTITSRYYEMLSDLSTTVQDQGSHGGSSEGTIEDKIQKALTNNNGLQKQISKIVAQIRELPDGPEKDALYQLRNSMMEDALNFYRQCMDGEIKDPQLYMQYRDYGQTIMAEARRLNDYADDYDFAPNFSRVSYITDPDKKGYRYDLKGKTDEETEAMKDLYVQYCQQEYSQAVGLTMANSEYKGADEVTQAILLSKAKDSAIAAAKQDMADYLTAHGYASRQSTVSEHEEEEREAKYMYQRIIGESRLNKAVSDTVLRLYNYSDEYSFSPPTYVPGSYVDPNDKQYGYVLTDNEEAKAEYKRLRDNVYNNVFQMLVDGPDFWQLDDEHQAMYLAAARSECTKITKKLFLQWAAENMERIPRVTEETELEKAINAYYSGLVKDFLNSRGYTY